MFKNYLLIGLPYSGKSYLGYNLSKITNMGFIETDKMIENYCKSKLKDIIKERGNKDFLFIENKISTTISCNNNIISSGGSMVYNLDTINYFKENLNSKVIYLHLSYDEFLKRINNLENRGVVNPSNLEIRDFYLERCCLGFTNSDVKIDTDDKILGLKNLLKETKNDF